MNDALCAAAGTTTCRNRAKWRDIISPVRGGVTGSCAARQNQRRRLADGVRGFGEGPALRPDCDTAPPDRPRRRCRRASPGIRCEVDAADCRQVLRAQHREGGAERHVVGRHRRGAQMLRDERREIAVGGLREPVPARSRHRAARKARRGSCRRQSRGRASPPLAGAFADDGSRRVTAPSTKRRSSAAISARGSGKADAARRIFAAALDQRVERGLGVSRYRRWKRHRQRGRAVEDDRARRAGIAQRIQQGRARAPRAAPDVDAVVTEVAADVVEIGKRLVMGVEARIRRERGGAALRLLPQSHRPRARGARRRASRTSAGSTRRSRESPRARCRDGAAPRGSTAPPPVPARARPGRVRPPAGTADRARRSAAAPAAPQRESRCGGPPGCRDPRRPRERRSGSLRRGHRYDTVRARTAQSRRRRTRSPGRPATTGSAGAYPDSPPSGQNLTKFKGSNWFHGSLELLEHLAPWFFGEALRSTGSMSRQYRAGQSVEDYCRQCHEDRIHTVIVVDAHAQPLRVTCDFCRSEHNYRGGPRTAPGPQNSSDFKRSASLKSGAAPASHPVFITKRTRHDASHQQTAISKRRFAASFARKPD